MLCMAVLCIPSKGCRSDVVVQCVSARGFFSPTLLHQTEVRAEVGVDTFSHLAHRLLEGGGLQGGHHLPPAEKAQVAALRVGGALAVLLGQRRKVGAGVEDR